MAEKSKSLELKVGLFVFIGLIILAFFVLRIGDFKVVRFGYGIRVVFSFANGIKVGAPVRVAGIDKGEVKEIRLTHTPEGKTEAIIMANIESGSVIPADSRAWVNTLGLLGEKYLEIIPGRDYQHVLSAGEILRGEDPTSIQEVTDLVKDVALQTQDTLTSMRETMTAMNLVLTDLHGGRGTVGRLFTEDTLYRDIEEMFADLKKHPWKLLYRPK